MAKDAKRTGSDRAGSAGGGDNRTGGPLIAITMGDPAGIGPEIVVKALVRPAVRATGGFVVFGSANELLRQASAIGSEREWQMVARIDHPDHVGQGIPPAAGEVVVVDADEYPDVRLSALDPGVPSAHSGRASFAYLGMAFESVLHPQKTLDDPWRGHTLVTAPISKAAWDMARRADPAYDRVMTGHKQFHGAFPGHTELLAERFDSLRVGMLFAGDKLRVMLATIHVPLKRVPEILTTEKVLDAIELAAEGCSRLGVDKPRLAVCGLNPHAGEGGLLGDEDDRVIRPAVETARAKGINVTGPLPADTIFGKALLENGRRIREDGFDCVVAMYHDQGLIPAKLLEPHGTVNVTVGIPGLIRTSPAHGTAFDIAGKGIADERAMVSAIRMAVAMSRQQDSQR